MENLTPGLNYFPMKLNLFQKLKTILENKERWQSVEGAVEFEKYVELLSKFFSEKETDRAKNMTKEIEEAYANALSGGFQLLYLPYWFILQRTIS